jgi:formylglycine-generating enzyme required for sulfatase activity
MPRSCRFGWLRVCLGAATFGVSQAVAVAVAGEDVVVGGGSFLCTDQYCTRYMVGTRGKGEVSTGSNHLGFRCAQKP